MTVARSPIWLVLFAGILSVACEPSLPTRATTAPAPIRVGFRRIALVGTSESDATWVVMKAVAERFKNEDKTLHMTYRAATEPSPTAQQAILRELRDSDVRTVCVMPIDPLAIRSEIDALVSKGILVVLVGTDVPDSKRVVFVGPTGMELGESTATASAAVMPDDRKTVMLLHAGSGNAVYGPRYSGFRLQSQIESGLEIFKELDCGGNSTEARRIVQRQMRLYPRLGCWAFLDDWPLRDASPDDRLVPAGCSVVLCRDDPAYFDAMRRGEIDAFVTYDLYEGVERAIRSAIRLSEDYEGETVDIYPMPPQIVTRDDLPWHESRWRRWRDGLPAPAKSTD